jgi:transaldolase
VEEVGITGLTSNRTIFEKALAQGEDYQQEMATALDLRLTPGQTYERLAVQDIREAADLLMPVFRSSRGRDGYVSLEVSPLVARDSEATVVAARRLWARVYRTNLMIKIPATEEGLEAIPLVMGQGVNVNVTLIFGLERYRQVLQAHLAGLQAVSRSGGSVTGIAFVASFFVSRVDTAVDRRLEELGQRRPELLALRGEAAVANARCARQIWEEWMATPAVEELTAAGAASPRLLWASTGAKDPSYRDVRYVEELVEPDTVNTMQLETIRALLDHGEVRGNTLLNEREHSRSVLAQLLSAGSDLEKIGAELEQAGVGLFSESYRNLVRGLAAQLRGRAGIPVAIHG